MKKIGIKILTLLPVFGLAVQAQAFTNPTPAPTQQSNTPQYVTPGTGGNAAQSGRDTSNAQLIGAAVNIGAAVMYMKICTQAYCSGCWACPLVGLASAASGLLNSASGQSGNAGMEMSGYNPMMYDPSLGGTGGNGQDPWGNTIGQDGSNTDGNGSGIGTNGTVPGLPPGTTSQTIARDIARIRSELDKSGVKMSPDGKTMTTPDGRSFDLSKGGGGSMQDLMAMGLSQSEAASAMAAGKNYAKKMDEKFKQMAQLPGSGGGGSGGRAVAAEGGGGDPFAGFDPFARERAARNRGKTKVSGLTKKLGSDTIGVAGDDIFEMVTRRYKARDEQNAFLKD